MAQACPTFCTRSTNCLPIWHKHGQPSIHTAQTVCLLVSDVMDITSVSLQLRVTQSSPQIWLQMSKSNVQALCCIYIFAGSRHAHMLCYGRESTKKWSQYLSQFSFSWQFSFVIYILHTFFLILFWQAMTCTWQWYSTQTEHEKLTTRPL